jgi:hypothetical protein
VNNHFTLKILEQPCFLWWVTLAPTASRPVKLTQFVGDMVPWVSYDDRAQCLPFFFVQVLVRRAMPRRPPCSDLSSCTIYHQGMARLEHVAYSKNSKDGEHLFHGSQIQDNRLTD